MYRFSKVSKSGKYSTLFYSTSFSEQICKILENWLEGIIRSYWSFHKCLVHLNNIFCVFVFRNTGKMVKPRVTFFVIFASATGILEVYILYIQYSSILVISFVCIYKYCKKWKFLYYFCRSYLIPVDLSPWPFKPFRPLQATQSGCQVDMLSSVWIWKKSTLRY